MRLKSILKIVAVVLIFNGVAMLLPLAFSLAYAETFEARAFVLSILITLFAGLAVYRATKNETRLSNKDGILVGVLSWMIVPVFGCLPYLFAGVFDTFTDAYFEAVSGYTTTGATVMRQIEAVSKSILLWRSFMQWLGGMGILLLFVALISGLGTGSTKLLRSETPGPLMFKIMPRYRKYAQSIWKVYIFLTLVEIVMLLFAGLDFFESLNHTFTSIATGGFSTRSEGLMAFNNIWVELIVIFFMVIGGGNLVLYYVVFAHRNPLLIFKDEEMRAYLLVLLAGFLVVVGSLAAFNYDNIVDAVRYGGFQVVSLKTGSGHLSFDYDQWNNLAKMTLFVLMFFGGCQHSTTGGIKMVRMLIGLKFTWREVAKYLHPNLVSQVKVNRTNIPDPVVQNVVGFFLLYFVLFFVTALLLAGYNFDNISSISASAAILGNVGPAMGIFGPTQNYAALPVMLKMWLTLIMIMGRLEIYPMLVLIRVLLDRQERQHLIS